MYNVDRVTQILDCAVATTPAEGARRVGHRRGEVDDLGDLQHETMAGGRHRAATPTTASVG